MSRILDAKRDLDRIKALEKQLAEVTAERDEARLLVTEANNSLYGSQGYFHSLDGGPFNKWHLANEIENIKATCRKAFRDLKAAKSRAARLAERLEMVEGALQMAREFIAEAKNNPRDDGKVVEIIGEIDAALKEPEASPLPERESE